MIKASQMHCDSNVQRDFSHGCYATDRKRLALLTT